MTQSDIETKQKCESPPCCCDGDRVPELTTGRDGNFLVYSQGGHDVEKFLHELMPDPDVVFNRGKVVSSPWQSPATDKTVIEIGGRKYFFKRYNCLGWFYRIKNMFRSSRALKSWKASWRFSAKDVPTPEPVICLEERRHFLLGRSYIMYPYLDGASSLLDAWEGFDEEDQRTSLLRLGAMIGRMHRQGVVHGDLNWRNLLVYKVRNQNFFYMVDLDGCLFRRRLDSQRARRDLAHFLRDLERAGGGDDLKTLFMDAWQQTAGLC